MEEDNNEEAEIKTGDCDVCGEWASELITGMCTPCRDKYDL